MQRHIRSHPRPEAQTTASQKQGEARILYPLSEEQKRFNAWREAFVLFCTRLQLHTLLKCVMWLSVVPATNFTNFSSLMYQAYLNQIVHQKRMTMVAHHICTPFVLMFAFALLSVFGGFVVPVLDVNVNWAVLGLCMQTAWYTWVGFRDKEYLPLLGLIAAPSNMLLASLGYMYGVFWHWEVLGGGVFMHPFSQMVFWSFLQALSHACEWTFPPHAAYGCLTWRTYEEHFSQRFLRRFIVYLCQAVPGTINEWLVSPRLHMIHMLEYTNKACGYGRDSLLLLEELVKESCDPAYGPNGQPNPATDYIGPGGGTPAWDAIPYDPAYRLPPTKTMVHLAPTA